MASVQEKLQLKREPLDKWSLREQLCLSSAVARSGDQNWMSVSRALKPFGENNRPPDWFHQKNCAAQYGVLLANVETPKRKKKSGVETVVETPAECIVKRLLSDRLVELKNLLAEEKSEYKKLQDDMKLLQSGKVTEDQLDKWCQEIDEEEHKREQEAQNHAKWLKQRELKKQEIELAWRPQKSSFPIKIGQKRKASDISDGFADNEIESQYQKPTQYQEVQLQVQHLQESPVKPALSPLLTSLLKSPSQVHVPTSAFHNAIVSQADSSPTITSLLNTSVQHFSASDDSSQPLVADILDDANIKIDDLAKSILVQDGPFPEIKKEEVDDIISEIIENAHDIVADPEQHLQLDGNGDINIELEDLEPEAPVNEEIPKQELVDADVDNKTEIKPSLAAPAIDPFEFREDPVLFESPLKPSTLKQENSQYNVPLYQASSVKNDDVNKQSVENVTEDKQPSNIEGSVEIVEVVTEERGNEKELDQAQICDIVQGENKPDVARESPEPELVQETEDGLDEQKPTDINLTSFASQSESSLDYPDDLYDNVNMEVKIDKSGKAKRDYSRTKKREEKSFDMLLAIEKAHLDDMNMSDDMAEYKEENHKKPENERSTSPWTEEEDSKVNKRRTSTSGTPVDSLPNSPASSIAYYDDDKDYRNWKKSVMLVYNRLASNKYASLFLKPITDDQAPGYGTVVFRPMDLQTIKKNIDNGVIRTSLEFKRDVMLMFTNAIMYNKTSDTVYNMALQMQQESLNPIEILLQAEGQVEAPSRRETRTSELICKRKRLSEDCSKAKKKKDD